MNERTIQEEESQSVMIQTEEVKKQKQGSLPVSALCGWVNCDIKGIQERLAADTIFILNKDKILKVLVNVTGIISYVGGSYGHE